MKKILTMILVMLLLVGCGAKGSTEGGTGAATGGKDTITVVSAYDVISMDNAVATDGTSFIAQTMCLSGLMELDKNNNPVNDLAESYEVSDDGLVYTFHIRKDANWSNGDPVKAEDFVYGWQRIVDPDLASEYNWIMETANIKNGGCYDPESGLKKEDLGIKAVDEKTFEVELTTPTGFFLSLLAFPTFFPVNKAFAEKLGNQYALSVDNMVYCGPYVMSNWTSGMSFDFTLNEKYFGYNDYVANGNAKNISFRVISDTQTALLEYNSGNLHTVQLSGEQVTGNKDVEGFTERLQGYLYYLLLNINNTDNKDLTNANARKALSYCLDRETIAAALNDGSVAAGGIIPFDLSSNPETGVEYRKDSGTIVEFNLDKAKEAYEAAKKELGHDITVELLYGTDEGDSIIKAAEQTQYYLEQAGFTVNLNGKPKKERLALQTSHDFQISLTRWGPDYADPQTFMDMFISTNTANNQGGWNNKEYDALLEKAKAPGTSAIDRYKTFVEAEKLLIAQEFAVAPVFQAGGAMLISPKITGIEFHSAGVDNYRHMKFVD